MSRVRFAVVERSQQRSVHIYVVTMHCRARQTQVAATCSWQLAFMFYDVELYTMTINHAYGAEGEARAVASGLQMTRGPQWDGR